MKVTQQQAKNDSGRSVTSTNQNNQQNSTAQLVDQRPQTVALRDLIADISDSPRMLAQRRKIESYQDSGQLHSAIPPYSTAQNNPQPVQRAKRSEDEKKNPLQGKSISDESEQLERQPDSQANNTSLPNNLKAGIEQLSGLAMDDVSVHYNSPKPAQLQALAYAQGTEIHLGPGQQQHLPHEAWHVVQQLQGRVQPTLQAKGMMINDSPRLENEAELMGKKAAEITAGDAQLKRSPNNSTPASVQQIVQPFWLKTDETVTWVNSEVDTKKYKVTNEKRWKYSYMPSLLGYGNEELPVYTEIKTPVKNNNQKTQPAKQIVKTPEQIEKENKQDAKEKALKEEKEKISKSQLAKPNLWVVEVNKQNLTDFLAGYNLVVIFSTNSKSVKGNQNLVEVERIETGTGSVALTDNEKEAIKKFIDVMNQIKDQEAWITFGPKLKYDEIQTLPQLYFPNISTETKIYHLGVLAHEIYENYIARKAKTNSTTNDYWKPDSTQSGFKAAHTQALDIESGIDAAGGLGRRIGQMRKATNNHNAIALLEKGALVMDPNAPQTNEWVNCAENRFPVNFESVKPNSSNVNIKDTDVFKTAKDLFKGREDYYGIVKGNFNSVNTVKDGFNPSHFIFNTLNEELSLNKNKGTTRLAQNNATIPASGTNGNTLEIVEIIIFIPDEKLINKLK